MDGIIKNRIQHNKNRKNGNQEMGTIRRTITDINNNRNRIKISEDEILEKNFERCVTDMRIGDYIIINMT